MAERRKPGLNSSYDEVTRYLVRPRLKKYFYDRLRVEFKRNPIVEKYKNKVEKIINAIEDGSIKVTNRNDFFTGDCLASDPDAPFFYYYAQNFDEYILSVVYCLKKLVSVNATDVTFTQLFINITRYYDKFKGKDITTKSLFHALREIALASVSFIESSKFTFRILDRKLAFRFSKKYNFDPETYEVVWKTFIAACNSVKKTTYAPRIYLPDICMVHEVFQKYEKEKQLRVTLGIPYDDIREEFENMYLLELDEEFEARLSNLINLPKENNLVQRLKQEFIAGEDEFLFTKDDTKIHLYKGNLTHTYVYRTTYQSSPFPAIAEVTVSYDKENVKDLKKLIHYAVALLAVRETPVEYRNNMKCEAKKGLRLIIKGTVPPNMTLIKLFVNILKSMRRIYKRNIYFEIQMNPGHKSTPVTEVKQDKICILSDIHADYNRDNMQPVITKNKFVINCGDTSGNAKYTADWIKTNMDFGVFVHGNHMCYSGSMTIEDSIEYLKEQFPLDADVSYLNNSYKEYKGIIFAGCCLYTDFCLYGDDKKDEYKNYAQRGMNDFRLVYRRENGMKRLITPDDYETWHNESVRFLSEVSLKYSDMPIVVVSHFAPLPDSVHEKYKGSPLNAAFANDLSYLLRSRPNITLWCHGHVHDKFDYMYAKTRIICNPYGYYTERGNDKFTPETFPFEDIIRKRLLK